MLFASCQGIEEGLPEMEHGSVLAQFSLSLPRKGYATRMSADIMQSAGTASSFRGIEDIWLIPFATSSEVAGNSRPIGVSPFLASILKPTATVIANNIPSTSLIANNNAVLFGNVDLPTEMRSMLFYGRAAEDAADASLSADSRKHKNGVLLHPSLPMDMSLTASSLSFTLETITSDAAANTASDAMLTYLNSIVTALGNDNLLNNSDVRDFLDNEAGSSPNVRALVQDLYRTLHVSAGTTNTLAAIRTGFQDVDSDGDVDDDDIISSSAALTADLDNYPANLYLPDGAAAIEYVDVSGTRQFRLVTGRSFGGLDIAPPRIYAYPPALYYRGNSAIRTSKVSQQDNYVSTNTWDEILDGYGANASAVEATTHSVAMEDAVQYAVGRLDIDVQTDDGNIPDHNGTTVAVPAQGFPLTAVLVSNQRSVNYLFNAADLDAEGLTVYDTAIGTVNAPRQASAGNYAHTASTLVLQTPSTKDIADLVSTPKHKVYVALEFRNNTGNSFVGNNGQIIPQDCHFYLIGELNPTQLDGYDINDEVKSRVFTQDHVTTVNFTITSLADAYNVIPDLRVPELRIGLRIDTNWQVGYNFTDAYTEIHR